MAALNAPYSDDDRRTFWLNVGAERPEPSAFGSVLVGAGAVVLGVLAL